MYVFVFPSQSLMDEFNPGLQKLVSLGGSYVQAFKGKKGKKKERKSQSEAVT